MRDILQLCRSKFGAPPRKFSLFDRAYLYPSPPSWMKGGTDELLQIYRDRDKLLLRGRGCARKLL